MLTRADLLAVAPEAFAPHPVTLSGDRVALVRALDAVELARARGKAADLTEFQLWVGLFGVVDADGKRLLEPADFPAFARLGIDAHVIARRVSELTGLDESAADAKKG